MTGKAVRLSPEAREEIAIAFEWYIEHSTVADDFLSDLDAAIRSLRRPGPECRPALGVPVELGIRRKLLRRFPYVVVFKEFSKTVRVLAVAHAHRRPGYWRHRR